ncbi:hypothetical protein [Enterovibrio calviensis]|uniref:hypothetical protein n=1 Tax=Enterovibrio calviensis TaxID=91359 RepID=UPI003735CD73
MVNRLNVTPTLLNQLAQRIQQATASRDWQTLKALDIKVRELLLRHPECLKSAACAAEISQLKATHQVALLALSESLTEMETELDVMQAQNERAMAYQLAMTMEY